MIKFETTYKCLVFACLASFVLISALSLKHFGLTYDEALNYNYAQRVLDHHPQRNLSDLAKMPVNALNVLGGKIISHLFHLNDPVSAGRYVTIIAGLILAFYVFRWSYKLYGPVPALFSLFLFSFDPNIIAHSRLVTGDIYAALMSTISLYYFWKFLKYGGWKRALVSGLILGLSQSAKYTCLFFYPLFFFLGTGKYLSLCYELAKQKCYSSIRTLTLKFLACNVMFIVAGILMINLCFGFVLSGKPLMDHKFNGHALQSLQTIPLLKQLPIPLPDAYLTGLDMLDLSNATGCTYGNIYLFGHLKDKNKGDIKGFPGYYFFVYLFKTPLSAQLIILAALLNYLFRRRFYHFIRDEIFLLAPLLCLGIYFNFFMNIQLGIRYILFCFPLLYIFAGNLFVGWYAFKPSVKTICAALLLYLAISTLSYAPFFISYFNEIVWDRKQSYTLLADSNLDWGGYEWYVDQYMIKHPGTIYEPGCPTRGHLLVGSNQLVGIIHPQLFSWLRENYKPVDQVAYAFLVYDVKSLPAQSTK